MVRIAELEAPGRLRRTCPCPHSHHKTAPWSFRESPHAHAQPYDTSEDESTLLPKPAHWKSALTPEDKGAMFPKRMGRTGSGELDLATRRT